MTRLNSFAHDADGALIAASIAEHGYAIVQDMLAPDTLERLRSELQPHLDAAEGGKEAFMGARTKRIGALLSRSAVSRDMALDPLLLDLVERVLGPYCARVQLNYTGLMYLMPGEKAQPLHRDAALYPFQNPAPPTICATMFAVSDFTRENGATWLVPGSHLWDDAREPRAEEVIQAEMPAGSMLIYNGSTYHAGGANHSNGARFGCAIQYSLGWLRQEENQYMAVPPELAKTFPRRLQELMGYDMATVNLGMVDHKHPNDILNGTADSGPGELGPQWLIDADNAIQRLKVTGYAATGRPRYYVDGEVVQGPRA
jgi:ectoine hydroxylase-related dioxygenase (phytanoyl-CoA dioxygenase family)